MIFKKVKRTLMSYSDNFPVFYECIELNLFEIPTVPNIFLEIRHLLFLKRISDHNNNYNDKLDKDFFFIQNNSTYKGTTLYNKAHFGIKNTRFGVFVQRMAQSFSKYLVALVQ